MGSFNLSGEKRNIGGFGSAGVAYATDLRFRDFFFWVYVFSILQKVSQISVFTQNSQSFDLKNRVSFKGHCPLLNGLYLTETECFNISLVEDCNDVYFIPWDILYEFIK